VQLKLLGHGADRKCLGSLLHCRFPIADFQLACCLVSIT
jgi:hypothetical protein